MANLLQKISAIRTDIKLAHTVFALPFALLATFWAAKGWPGGIELALIVVCMIFARTFAMLSNRWVDREIDAANPRTAGRALPAGQLSSRDVIIAMIICTIGLGLGAAGFGWLDQNWWPLLASPLVLAWLGAYGLFKRFTLLAHFFLGGALALSPLAAGLAIDPDSLFHPTLWYLAGFIVLWVGGFDVIYALQDETFDREAGLHSIPARLGQDRALMIAKLAHFIAILLLILVSFSTWLFGQFFWIGIIIVAMLLTIEHRLAFKGQFSMAFFTVNGVISVLLGALGIVDIFRRAEFGW